MIPVSQAHLQVFAATDPGRQGKNNEDRYAVSAFILTEHHPIPAVVAIVADGIGGHRAGEIASEMAVESISRIVANSDAARPTAILQDAFSASSRAIYSRSESDSALSGMGTTCSCCWIIADQLYTATVGDSRIYLRRADSIQQLSIDHTWIQEAIDLGAISPDQAASHPNLHVIRRYLGTREHLEVDTRLRLDQETGAALDESNQGLRLLPGDQVMLCTDGLTDVVKQDEILEVLQRQAGQAAVESLVDLANQRGGPDNITIVLLQVPEKPLQPPKPPRRRALILTCAAISLILLLIAALLAGNWYLQRSFRRILQGDSTPVVTLTVTASATVSSSGALPKSLTVQPTDTVQGSPPAPPTAPNPATLTPWPTNTP